MTLKELILTMDQNDSLQLINSSTGDPLTDITSDSTSFNNMNDPKLSIIEYYDKEVKSIKIEYDSCTEEPVTAYLAISVDPIPLKEDKHNFVKFEDNDEYVRCTTCGKIINIGLK